MVFLKFRRRLRMHRNCPEGLKWRGKKNSKNIVETVLESCF